MTERRETYSIVGQPTCTIQIQRGDIRVKEGDVGTISLYIEGSPDAVDSLEIDATEDSVTLRSTERKKRWFGGSVSVLATVPRGADITVNLGAGDVMVTVPVGELEVNVGSGDIRVHDVSGTATIKVGSGDIRIEELHAGGRIASAAGDVRIDTATDVTVTTAAGDLYLGDVTEAARVKSATGDIRVVRFAGTDLEIKTMSGDATIGLVPGRIVNAAVKTMSGDFRNRIKPSSVEKTGTINLTVTSFSGDVTLRSAK